MMHIPVSGQRTGHNTLRGRARLAAGLALAAAFFAPGAANAYEWSTIQAITELQTYSAIGSSQGFYYVRSSPGGWGAPSCPGAQWAYITSDRILASQIFALAMQARQLSKQVAVAGVCDGTAYFKIEVLWVQS